MRSLFVIFLSMTTVYVLYEGSSYIVMKYPVVADIFVDATVKYVSIGIKMTV